MATGASLSDFGKWRGRGFEAQTEAPRHDHVLPAASRSHDYFGHENWDHQLKLAVAWNRVDIARSEIFSGERQWKVRPLRGPVVGLIGRQERGQALEGASVHPSPGPGGERSGPLPPFPSQGPQRSGSSGPAMGCVRAVPHGALSQPSELHPVMMAALISNKPEFVKLFLENGVRLKEFVTWDTLLSLYQHLDPSCLFHSKLQKVLAEEPERPAGGPTVPHVQMHHVAQVLRELLGDFTQPLYPRPRTGDRPRLLLPVPNMKLNVRAGDPLLLPPPTAGPGCWAAASP